MSKTIKFSFIVIFIQLLVACSTQPPAPIQYKEAQSLNDLTQYYSQEDKERKSLLEEIAAEDKNQDTLIESEKIHDEREEVKVRDKTKQLDLQIKEVLATKSEEKEELVTKKQSTVKKAKTLEGLNAALIKPVDGYLIKEFSNDHKAISVATKLRNSVKSVYDGQVIYSGHDNKFGNLVIIKLKNTDYFVALAYLDDIMVTKGSLVKKGEVIGHAGQTGGASEPQLYIALKKGKEPIDPLLYLNYSSFN